MYTYSGIYGYLHVQSFLVLPSLPAEPWLASLPWRRKSPEAQTDSTKRPMSENWLMVEPCLKHCLTIILSGIGFAWFSVFFSKILKVQKILLNKRLDRWKMASSVGRQKIADSLESKLSGRMTGLSNKPQRR